jgi:hypothetical protein
VATGGVTQCQAEARWGSGGYANIRDVTADASWSSSAPSVLGVVGPGRTRAMTPGEAELRAAFREVAASQAMRVYPGEAPSPVFYGHELIGYVRDPTLPAQNNGVGDVLVEVVGGHNAGRTTVSSADGTYTLKDPVYGPITYRARKAGYGDAMAEGFVGRNPVDPSMSAAPTLYLAPLP